MLYSLINANRDLNFLRNYYSGLEGLNRGGAIGNLTISPGVSLIVAQKTNLFSAMQNFSIVRNYRDIYKNAWDSLSEEEKADLEFYIILTLHSPGNYIAGFAKVHTLAAYKTAFDYVNRLYAHAKTQANNFWNTVAIPAYKTMRDTNKNARGRILSAHNETLTNVNNWINELTYILTTTQNIASAFKESNERLESLEGTANEGEIVTWEDINQALFDSGKISEEDIADLKLYWETMQENTNRDFTCVSSAITAMQYWANNEEIRAKNALENQWLRDARTQMLNENDFLTAVDAFIAGTIDIETLRAAAEKAYGENSISLKYHQYNMHKILSNKLSMYQTIDNNFFNVFGTIGQEIIFLTAKTLESRFLAELAAREIEWSLVMKEISDKYSEWLDSAALIFERGRADWLAGFDRLEEAYKQWVLEFENEYNRVNGEWNEAYLAGLMDKERWLEMAANAANQASSEAFLFLMGTEGERLARIVDTREPLGFHIGMPETQEMINELLQASGIVNMTNAFGVINNITNTISTNVRRGMSSVSGWDSVLVKTAAAELARNINSEIADNEARKLAFNAQITAEEAVKGLIESVDLANEDFRRSMDNTFIFKGLWTRSGNNYVKDIVRGSTLFTPIISETVTVTGYANYIMEPITLKTNLDENFLAALNSVAIHGLIENVFLEIQIITAEIFGTGENPISVSGNRKQSPGSFGAHIGYEPNLRPKDNFGNTRSSIFFDQGAGEHGRLMSEYVFWDVIDRKGSAELSLAPWDRRMWDDDGSWFSSPSLRTVGSIAGGIAAGIATGGMSFIGTIAVTALISSSSEILFSSLDAAAGFKTFDEAAFSIGKTLLTNTVSGLTSGLFAGAGGFEGITSKVLSKTSGTANTIFTQTAMTGVQTLTTGLTSSVISGITYSNNDGWGFSNDVFKAGISGVLQSTLTAMTSTFTTTSLTAINSGLDLNKLIGFNKLNQDDIKNLNGLIGSLAGQGVNYALGNDFKLNVLNLNLIIGGKLNNGLLELNFGRNGTTMNIGTGGANVSIDNLVSSFRGAAVWNVNSQINRYIKRESQEGGNQFEAAITLRTQYGYGDTKQKNLLRDIIRGNVLLITDHEAYYDARTEIIDGQRVIYFGNYQQGMSMEDQFRLAVILGHEAYRDGFAVGEIDVFGNTVTNESNFDELRTASIARIAMGDRIQDEHSWFYIHNQDFFVESLLLSNAMTIGNFSLFNSYLEIAYYNDKDYFFKNTTTRDNHQNESRYNNIPLFNARTREQVNEENEIRMEAAFRRYLTETYTEENINTATPFDIFRQNRELLGSNGYIPEPFVSLSGYGCKFFSMKYIYEAITGGNIDAVELHNFVLDNNTFSGRSLLSSQDIADTINKHSNENFSILFDSGNSGNPSVIDLFKLHQSERMYFAILRVPNGSGGIHFVTLDHIEFTFDLLGRPTGISNVHVANPWNSNGFLGKQSYTFTEILNWEIFMRAPAFLRQHHSRLIDNFLKNR
ncbi:MAG: hypothetical protein FWC97_06625 [Treponema sp.]|nr:hypothetical protein [Treponema sp.]